MASFADKLNKATSDFSKHCPVCGEAISYIKLVTSERSDKSSAWRFNQKMVGICKCNEKDILG